MAAYATLVSLMSVLEGVLHPTRHWILLDREQIQSLQQKVCFLLDFLVDFSLSSIKVEIDGLESEMTAASYPAEDIIESFVLDQILARSADRSEESLTRFSEDTQKVIEDMDSIEEKVMQIKEKMGVMKDQQRVNYVPAAGLSRSAPSSESTMVGFEDHLKHMMERLMAPQSVLQIISIVGMAGIGKTTLAKRIYDYKIIGEHFDVRAWVTISQEFTGREILLAILHDVDKEKQERNEDLVVDRRKVTIDVNKKKQESNENLTGEQKEQESAISDERLRERLHKALFNRRYLIVMDDMWSVEVWDKVRRFIPDCCNESRIMITTRLSNVADCVGSSYKMDFLDEDKSWNLFCEKVFPQEGCPLEFEEIGRKIVKSCRGLPLAIVAIGGLLAKSDRTLEHLEYVAENLNTILNSGSDDNFLKILSLSYSHLPIHLKPCFLYMATFPEDCEIRVSKLIKLWVAEGFLKPIKDKSLEDIANEYLNDLIDRNLILVEKRGTTGKLKSCIVHDLLRELCLREAHKENFLCVTRVDRLDIARNIESKRRLGIHGSTVKHVYCPDLVCALQSASLARTVMCDFTCQTPELVSRLRLLRVLNVVDKYSPKEIMELFNSRYLAFLDDWGWHQRLTSSISLLWNVQTLAAGSVQLLLQQSTTILPCEIWDMPQLRHIEFKELVLPDPPHPRVAARRNVCVLENLQTIFTVLNFRCTEKVFKRVPNLKKMKIVYRVLPEGEGWSYYCLKNLVHLDKLESLTCRIYTSDKISAGNIAFPTSLKKLTLRGCRLPWKDMAIVGLLPSLEVLKLEFFAFEGPRWCPTDGEIFRLKFFEIGQTNLKYCRVDSTYFPNLEHLVLQTPELKKISLDPAEVPMLRLIQLIDCKDSVVTSTNKILKECEMLGKENLQVEVRTKDGSVFISASDCSNEVKSEDSDEVESEYSEVESEYSDEMDIEP